MLLAVTVIGTDRPGIVADVTGALAGIEANLEDSTMTLLRGHFAMVVLVRTEESAAQIADRLDGLTADGALAVDVRAVPEQTPLARAATATHLVHVNGADRPGIVATITAALAGHGATIVDLSTRLASGLYILTAEVELPASADSGEVEAAVAAAAANAGVNARLVPVDLDEM